MDLFSKESVKNLLKSHKTLPQKKLGQNFLTDKTAMGRILEAADIHQDDVVLEIGAGIGNLTHELAKKAKRVIAVEKDPDMVKILKNNLSDFKNVEIVQEDIRKINPEYYLLNTKYYKVVANIPYYLTAFLIRSLLESKTPLKDMVLIIQKEVAQRICAKVPDINLLAVSVQFYAKPKIISYIKKSYFWPVPKVDSAIIKIIPKNQSEISAIAEIHDSFFRIAKAGFSQPRKQLLNNLKNGLKLDREYVKSWLLENNIQPTQRAETLSMEDWIKLVINKKGARLLGK